jgi:lipopolysaccharide transport system permease protein
MVFAGTLPWTLFSIGLSEASQQLNQQCESDQQSIFPAADCAHRSSRCCLRRYPDILFDAACHDGLVVTRPVGGCWFYQHLTLLAFLASMGPALWITALKVKYHDFRYVIPFIM